MKSSITRRGFLTRAGCLAGTALIGPPLVSSAADTPLGREGPLPRVELGRTKVSITRLTVGTAPCGCAQPNSPQKVADCVNAALDLGVNAIDTAPAYQVAEEGIGLGLGARRPEVFLSSKVLADTVADAEKTLARSLSRLKTDYLDLAYFHDVGARQVEAALKPDGVFSWLLKQKAAGRIRFVGISGHNRPAQFLPLLETGKVEVVLLVVNFVDCHTYRFEETVVPVARRHGAGIVAMKVFGGARKMNYADPANPPQLEVRHLESAVRYALSVPGVTSVNLGVGSVEQVRQNVAMVKRFTPLSESERQPLLAQGKVLAEQWGPHFGSVT